MSQASAVGIRTPLQHIPWTSLCRLHEMQDLPPIPEGATGWDYERLNSTAYQIMALDDMVRLADDGLERRGVSEEARHAFWEELAKNLEPLTHIDDDRWSPEIPKSLRRALTSEIEKVIKVLVHRHRFSEATGPSAPSGGIYTWQCIRCGMLPSNLRQGCPTCGLAGWLKRVPA